MVHALRYIVSYALCACIENLKPEANNYTQSCISDGEIFLSIDAKTNLDNSRNSGSTQHNAHCTGFCSRLRDDGNDNFPVKNKSRGN